MVATEHDANGCVGSGVPALACIGVMPMPIMPMPVPDDDAFFSLGVTKGTKGGGGALVLRRHRGFIVSAPCTT